MICPKCGSEELKVNESRDLENGNAIRRRRECLNCANRFTTYERIETPGLVVVKRSGGREGYSRPKLQRGVALALEKRSFSEEEIEKLVSSVERRMNLLGQNEIESSVIGEIVLDELKNVDDVAYLRFASVYKSFADVGEFKQEVDEMALGSTKLHGRDNNIK